MLYAVIGHLVKLLSWVIWKLWNVPNELKDVSKVTPSGI